METILYSMLIAACAAFVIKTVVFFIDRTESKKWRAVREAEQRMKKEVYSNARLERLEEYKTQIERNGEKVAEKIFDRMIED